MRLLLLVQAEQRSNFNTWYEALAEKSTSCEILRVNSKSQRDLKVFFKQENIQLSQYDRIIPFLRFKKLMSQVKFLQTIPNLCLIEIDACQNYCKSKYTGTFSKYYSQLPWARIFCTGMALCEDLQSEGLDAHYFNKCYDHKLLRNLNQTRDIELAFLGSLESGVYNQRKQLIESIANREKLLIQRTNSGEEYLEMLNRIRFFVNADMPFREYMIKNFEAMACGCVLFTWDNGNLENKAIGFIDMENVVLYKHEEEFCEKLNILRQNPQLAEKIALNGEHLVQTRHTWNHAADKIVAKLAEPLRIPKVTRSFWGLKKNISFQEK